MQNLARAVQILGKAGVGVTMPLGQIQHADRNGSLVPIHGGTNAEGTTNVVGDAAFSSTSEPLPPAQPTIAPHSTLTASGYPVDNGTSFLMALQLTPDALEAWDFLTYGDNGNPSSPVFTDSTKAFSDKQWRKVRFTDADIAADPHLTTEAVSGN